MKMKKTIHIHLVGIKGVAMAALAVYLKEKGMRVSGSDVTQVFPTDEELTRAGITSMEGFAATHVEGKHKPDAVYFTGAHNGLDNVEVQAALAQNIPALPHGKALGEITKGTRLLVAAGSHGKTTTSAMLAVLLTHAKLHPSYAIGCGSISGLGAAGHYGKSDWFVAEGDEYITDPSHDTTPRFMWLTPEILVVTNIDYDHPDAYPSLEAVTQAFVAVQKKSSLTIVNRDDPMSRPLLTGENVITYGFSPAADFHITHVGVGRERMFFTLEERNVSVGEFSMKVPGKHNVSNAVAALVAAHATGIPWDTLREGLLNFTGTKRRFEKLGTKNGITFYDDYAHHPTEIMATLKAARSWYPSERIIAIFQPHTYSRTKALLKEFSLAFSDADTVILTDIYASAREHETLGITGETLVQETMKHHPHVMYGSTMKDVESTLSRLAKPGDIVVLMGAGDIYTHAAALMKGLD